MIRTIQAVIGIASLIAIFGALTLATVKAEEAPSLDTVPPVPSAPPCTSIIAFSAELKTKHGEIPFFDLPNIAKTAMIRVFINPQTTTWTAIDITFSNGRACLVGVGAGAMPIITKPHNNIPGTPS